MTVDPVGFIPFGAPGSPVPQLHARELPPPINPRRLLALLGESTKSADGDDGLASAARRSFALTLASALHQAPRAAGPRSDFGPPAASTPDSERAAPAPVPLARPSARAEVADAPALPPIRGEAGQIAKFAERAGIDAAFLQALRRVENGGPGREFGVLSVAAPTYDDQARVAAETVRRNVERFEATGRAAVDPATGRYSEEFVRFFSGRYAPVGAANDSGNLNSYHARNLMRMYAQLAPRE